MGRQGMKRQRKKRRRKTKQRKMKLRKMSQRKRKQSKKRKQKMRVKINQPMGMHLRRMRPILRERLRMIPKNLQKENPTQQMKHNEQLRPKTFYSIQKKGYFLLYQYIYFDKDILWKSERTKNMKCYLCTRTNLKPKF